MNLWHGIISKARIKQIVRKEPRKNNITHILFGKMLQFLKFISIQEAHPEFFAFFFVCHIHILLPSYRRAGGADAMFTQLNYYTH